MSDSRRGTKRKSSDESLRRKIRRLEKQLQLRRYYSDVSDYSTDDGEHSSDPIPAESLGSSDVQSADESENEQAVLSHTEAEVVDEIRPPSRPASPVGDSNDIASSAVAPPEQPAIPPEFLNALGEPKSKEVPLGSKIPEEVSKRWGGILTDGLNKDRKQELMEKTLIPENFKLLKAPLLNQEIAAVLRESARNRDKRLEKAQDQLGIGLAGITTLMSSLLEGKSIEPADMVKRLSEIGQILLDLHFNETMNRRRLIIPNLDKKFLNMIREVKRDSHLFGENLGGTIKATKTAEKSGLQIKKTSSKKFTTQPGSWRGPPRQQAHQAARPSTSRGGGQTPAAPKRPAPPPRDRYQASAQRSTRSTRK